MSDPIIGSGRRGFKFEQKGFQERNLATLLETLSNKTVQKSIEALSKFEKDEWKSMAETALNLKLFTELGGISGLMSGMTASIKETLKLNIAAAFSPLTNMINQSINDIMNPFIENVITPIINNITTTITETITPLLEEVEPVLTGISSILIGYPIGTGIGAVIGAAIGLYFRSPEAGAIIGGFMGSAVELMLTAPTRLELTFGEQYMAWFQETGGSFEEFLVVYNASLNLPPPPPRREDRDLFF